MARAEPLRSLDAAALRRWAVIARAGLGAAASTIDALNVFPVPDADTGTNLLLTFEQALLAERFAVSSDAGIAELTDAFARAAVLSARGNSGVILSQLARGVAAGASENQATWGPAEVTTALRLAADYARSAVAEPQEGTILSVADAAANAAQKATGSTLSEITAAAVRAARASLEHSPQDLPVLHRAGVVDAGGAGFVVLLEALAAVVEGRAGVAGLDEAWAPAGNVSVAGACDLPTDGAGPGYEVMVVLEDSTAASVAALESDLLALGDSVVIAGDDSLRSVHVHTDHVAAALERADRAGTSRYPEITRFVDQRDGVAALGRLLLITESPALAAWANALGATTVEHQRLDPTVAEVVDALRALGGGVVVASSAGGLAAARAASDLTDECYVVPASSPVTAALALQACADFPPDASAAEAGRECTQLIDGIASMDVRTASGDLAAATRGALAQLVTDDTEIVTIVRGADADWQVLEEALADVRRSRPDVQTELLLGNSAEIAASVGAE